MCNVYSLDTDLDCLNIIVLTKLQSVTICNSLIYRERSEMEGPDMNEMVACHLSSTSFAPLVCILLSGSSSVELCPSGLFNPKHFVPLDPHLVLQA